MTGVGSRGQLNAAAAAGPPGLNPLIKFMMLILFAVLVLFITSVLLMMIFLVTVLAAKFIFKARSVATKGILSFALMIFMAQVLLVRSGDVILQYSIITVTEGSLKSGVLITGKFLSIIMMSWIFVATTRPADLSAALTSAGVPYRFSFLIVLSMRLVPVFRFELSNVREAQAMRGLKIGRRLSGLIRSVRYTTMPMLYSALSRVNTLAASMEGRGFSANPRKTFLHPVQMTRHDIALGIIAVIFAVEVYVSSALIVIW